MCISFEQGRIYRPWLKYQDKKERREDPDELNAFYKRLNGKFVFILKVFRSY